MLSAVLRIAAAFRFAAIALSTVIFDHAPSSSVDRRHPPVSEISVAIEVALLVTLTWPVAFNLT